MPPDRRACSRRGETPLYALRLVINQFLNPNYSQETTQDQIAADRSSAPYLRLRIVVRGDQDGRLRESMGGPGGDSLPAETRLRRSRVAGYRRQRRPQGGRKR